MADRGHSLGYGLYFYAERGERMDAVEKYRMRRDARLRARGFRADDEEETNNKWNNGGNHGNTKLPFGLCHRYGIEVGKDWSPRDAWSALEDKGVTPSGEFAKRSGKKTRIEKPLGTYNNVRVTKHGDLYSIRGDMEARKGTPASDNVHIASFKNKNEMFAFLQEYGVNHAIDPDTGKKVNPLTMNLPKTVAKKGEQRFTDLVLGTRVDKSGAPYDRRGFTLVAKDFDGKKHSMGAFDTPEKAKEYAEKFLKCKLEDLRETKDFKAWAEKGMSPDEEYKSRYKTIGRDYIKS